MLDYNWGSGLGFTGLFQAVFGNRTGHVPFAFGISNLAMSQERLQMAHLMFSFLEYQFAVTVPAEDLLRVGDGAFLPSLAQLATVKTWTVIAIIFGLYALIISRSIGSEYPIFSRSSICHAWKSAFKLFAVSIGQGNNYVWELEHISAHPSLGPYFGSFPAKCLIDCLVDFFLFAKLNPVCFQSHVV